MERCSPSALPIWATGCGPPADARGSRTRIPRSSVCDCGAPAPSSAAATRGPPPSPRGLDTAGHLAEVDAGAVRAGRAGGEGHDVAVLEEGAGAAVGEADRLATAPGQLDEGAALVPARAGDGAGGEQV